MQYISSSVVFSWFYYILLIGLVLAACYNDVRSMTIPKWVTLPTFGLGIILNVVRNVWFVTGEVLPRNYIAAQLAVFADHPLSKLWWCADYFWAKPSMTVAALYGLLFALAGFAVGFGLFLVMYILGTCGGGDVKLFGAIGACVGPVLVIYLLIGTIVFVIFFKVLQVIRTALARKGHEVKRQRRSPNQVRKEKTGVLTGISGECGTHIAMEITAGVEAVVVMRDA